MSHHDSEAPGTPQPYGSQPGSGADPYAAAPYGTDPYAAGSYGTDPYSADPYSADPYSVNAYSSGSSAGDPYAYQAAAGAQSYGQAGYVQQAPQNTMALLSLILSLVGLATGGATAVVGIILGHIAKSQIKRTGESGDSLATWGLIVGYILVGLGVLIAVGYFIFVFLFVGFGVYGAGGF